MTRNRDIADFNPEFYSGKNLLINGCLSEYQRGESGTGEYVADRMRQSGVSASSKNMVNTPNGYLQGHYISRAESGEFFFGQRIEAAISAQAAGEDVTFSFELYDVTGIDSLEVVAYHTSAKDNWSTQSILFFTKALADLTNGRKAVTIPNLPEMVKHGLYVGLKATVSSSGSYKTTGLQLELGDEATRFIPDLPSVNLAKCQRYYEFIPKSPMRIGQSNSGNGARGAVNYTRKRAIPSFKGHDLGIVNDNVATVAILAVGASNVGLVQCRFDATVDSSSLTNNGVCFAQFSCSLDAEL
ncbi:hypothetical protein [Vibrio europaeus]|uniref:hypothetical protein n=1 Tax=Vibrio europaeus TaxID=300876 RepID=UPI00233E97E6|nr:hypothetical protein [Vibrio europaeus]MDC5753526.1 hypothetical protein [Vibrio europaeus]MDC5816561.1 hypothetical protein [Vibrio europaeus]